MAVRPRLMLAGAKAGFLVVLASREDLEWGAMPPV